MNGLTAAQQAFVETMSAACNPVDPPAVATGDLTRATLDAAIARLHEPLTIQTDPAWARAELALARWLDEQPSGTAEELLRQMYGREAGR
ncbi:hypothetical protein [Streptomyces sp. NPDC051554]|uniref:hypothetical protein n=1 Tax=Streptomyces sp. NPDC051554 TaxID=3365656 RepID=UPI0037902153